jgi:DNA (cytosine-5)-methyltransferase 1
MTTGSLFSGRGGFDIGAMAAGIETIWTCEIDEFLRNKLKRIVPNSKFYEDAKSVSFPPYTDIISAGFPCQDISVANQTGRKGIHSARSQLFREVARIANEIKPSYIILENSPEILKQGFEYVLCDLSAIGYNAEGDCWCAKDFGYPHNRKRFYCIAYSNSIRLQSSILQPPGTFELSQKWAPTEAYLRVVAGRTNGLRNIGSIQRDNVFPYMCREIKAFGNAAMPVVTEHLFKCILTVKYEY